LGTIDTKIVVKIEKIDKIATNYLREYGVIYVKNAQQGDFRRFPVRGYLEIRR